MSVTGGQATSIPLDEGKYGTSWMNDGVQGGSPVRFSEPLAWYATNHHLLDIQTHLQFLPEVWSPTPGSQAAGCFRQGAGWLLDQLLSKQVGRPVLK